jgi:hypothetical protein
LWRIYYPNQPVSFDEFERYKNTTENITTNKKYQERLANFAKKRYCLDKRLAKFAKKTLTEQSIR